MPSLASISDPNAYHIIAYGTLLGSNIFQSFFAGPIGYSCLPRPQFATLQTKITPPYFALQTALPVILAVTWPGIKIVDSAGKQLGRRESGWRGLLLDRHLWTALTPIAVMFGTSVLNLFVLGPATTQVMKKRKHQGMILSNRPTALVKILIG